MANDETLWLQSTAGEVANNRALQAIMATGKALPCTVTEVTYPGPLVTVTFDVSSPTWTLQPVTIPVLMAQWAMVPIQVGDVGVALSADIGLSGAAGTGPTPVVGQSLGNLGALLFAPIATQSFPAPPTNEFWGNGPDGARIGDVANVYYFDADATSKTLTIACGTSGSSISLSATAVTITVGAKTWTFSSSGFTDSSGVVEETHLHGGVTTGSSNTTGPIA